MHTKILNNLKMKKFISFILIFFIASNLFAQTFSNKGQDFWVAYGYHVRMTNQGGNTQEMVLYFATDQVTRITISIPGIGYTQTLTSGANPAVLTSNPIPKTGGQDARLVNESTSPENKGIHITSDKPIVAYAHIYNQSVSGATILFPTNTLGKSYYSINYTNNSNEDFSNCWFYVVASDTGITSVKITPSAATENHPAGVPFTVNLLQGQVFFVKGQFSGNTGVDLTGSKIESIASGNSGCKKIAVFSGSGKISITCGFSNNTSADNYMVQAFPKDAWGKKFLTVPTRSLNNNIYRICVSDPAAAVTLNGLPITYSLTNNFYYEIPITTQPLKIESDLPITVAQYTTTQGDCGNPPSNTNPGDPEVIYLSPVEQNISKVLWNATPNYNILEHYYNVVIPNKGRTSFKLDGQLIPNNSFFTHPQDTAYSYLNEKLLTSGSHIIESDSGFNAIAYGFGNAESYGYNAGTNIKDFSNFLTPINPFAVNIPNPQICAGTDFYFKVAFPFIPTYMKFDFGGLIPTENYPTQASVDALFDTTYIYLGKQVWIYKLNRTIVYNTVNTAPGNQVHVTAGLTSVEGCGGTYENDYYIPVYEPPVPLVGWQAHSGCNSDPVQFTDSTIYAPGISTIKWFWDFGDGNTDSIRNPMHTYSNPGTYTVKFALLSNMGCLSDTIIRRIVVSRVPTLNISTLNPICSGSNVNFTVTSNISSPDTVKTWYWDYGNGDLDTLRYPSLGSTVYNYDTLGVFNTSLYAVTNSGCVGPVVAHEIKIGDSPIAGFIKPDFCLLDPIAQFTDTSIFNPLDSIQNWYWTFGDPASGVLDTSNLQNPDHVYNTIGPKTIVLIVENLSGCKDTTIQTIYVTETKPVPQFSILNEGVICLNDSIKIKNTSLVNLGQLFSVKILWNSVDSPSIFDVDNNPLENEEYAHLYSNTRASGIYTIKMVVSTGGSCKDSTFQDVAVFPFPDVAFGIDKYKACVNENLLFSDSSTAYETALDLWHWNFGNGDTSILQNPIYQFDSTGQHFISLQVVDLNGCKSSIKIDSLNIYPFPIVDAGQDITILEGDNITLNASASGNDLVYHWASSLYLNDTSIIAPVCTPINDITYTFSATGEGGCVATDQLKVKVLKVPLIPNTFSPNNDGINDYWEIKFLADYPKAKVQVFTRTGQLVFEAKNGYKSPWNGKKNGVELPTDTYYYIIEPESGRAPKTGYITIIK
jgi:gliding motility-associated-like protein